MLNTNVRDMHREPGHFQLLRPLSVPERSVFFWWSDNNYCASQCAVDMAAWTRAHCTWRPVPHRRQLVNWFTSGLFIFAHVVHAGFGETILPTLALPYVSAFTDSQYTVYFGVKNSERSCSTDRLTIQARPRPHTLTVIVDTQVALPQRLDSSSLALAQEYE